MGRKWKNLRDMSDMVVLCNLEEILNGKDKTQNVIEVSSVRDKTEGFARVSCIGLNIIL